MVGDGDLDGDGGDVEGDAGDCDDGDVEGDAGDGGDVEGGDVEGDDGEGDYVNSCTRWTTGRSRTLRTKINIGDDAPAGGNQEAMPRGWTGNYVNDMCDIVHHVIA